MKIDLHAHCLPRDCFNMTDSEGRPYGHTTGKGAAGRGEGTPAPTMPSVAELCDPERRIQDMEKMGFDMQALSLSPVNIVYHLNPEDGLYHSQNYNNGIAEMVRAYPDRFVGIATVPMQNVEKAVSELERAVNELGLMAVEILSDINGKNLDEPEIWPFYQKAQDLDIPIFVHPGLLSLGSQLEKYMFSNLVGNPFSTTLAVASIIFGGVLESFPRLKLLFSHAGGFAPYIRGRWEQGYHCLGSSHSIPRPPSEYFKLMYFDSITYFGPALAYLINTVGADRVALGSDYPFRMTELNPVTSVRKADGISQTDREKVMEHTAIALLKLTV